MPPGLGGHERDYAHDAGCKIQGSGCWIQCSESELPTLSMARYALNWVKLRAWELEGWDALLMLDADTTVVSDIRSLFTLPTDFAVVLDEDKKARRFACAPPLRSAGARPNCAVLQLNLLRYQPHGSADRVRGTSTTAIFLHDIVSGSQGMRVSLLKNAPEGSELGHENFVQNAPISSSGVCHCCGVCLRACPLLHLNPILTL